MKIFKNKNSQTRLMQITIEAIGILFAILWGTIGAIPQIIKWSKPKPRLKIIHMELTPENQNACSRYCFSYEIVNESVFWRRPSGATAVKIDVHTMDSNKTQCKEIQSLSVSTYLGGGEKAQNNYLINAFTKKGVNPHTVIFELSCSEGQKVTKKQQMNF
ncbi:MAG: hypothetical protein NWE92_12055 [Candidatus Bathyarchaeota archaeon]|nr:hypothetical protein [Candidatus Bathyarchaeota archaeon]